MVGLLKADVPVDLIRVQCRRILVYQLLYALGAALCFLSPTASLIAILLVQLNSALAPRIKWLERF